MKVTVLGSGTSSGIPQVGCSCPVCTSADPHDRRSRCSVLVSYHGQNVLIDTATDLRAQSLANGLTRIDAVLYTHHHADHVHGIDDLRAFNFVMKQDIPIYGAEGMMRYLREHFDYIFTTTQKGGGKPRLILNPVAGRFVLLGKNWELVEVMHGKLIIAGYRVGGFAYLTDASGLPEHSYAQLRGLDVLIIDALREKPEHPTHFTVDQALEQIRRIKPRRAFLTHMCHTIRHADLAARLPEGVDLAFDGQILEVADDEPAA